MYVFFWKLNSLYVPLFSSCNINEYQKIRISCQLSCRIHNLLVILAAQIKFAGYESYHIIHRVHCIYDDVWFLSVIDWRCVQCNTLILNPLYSLGWLIDQYLNRNMLNYSFSINWLMSKLYLSTENNQKNCFQARVRSL